MKMNFFKKISRFATLLSCLFISSLTAATETHTLYIKNKYISYKDVGKGQPLVLIHAFPTDKDLWAPQEKLKSHFRVITVDLWGFGNSEMTDGRAITMTEYASEIKELLDQLHLQKAIIGGESMGGYIALAFLNEYPNHVNGLILSNTQSIADSDEMKIKREASAVDVLQNGTANLISKFIPKAFSPQASEEKKKNLQHILEKQSPTAVASALRGMATRNDTSNLLAKSSIPILILTGDQDELISPDQSKNMHILAKNSQLIIIPAAGHLSKLEKPDQWNQAIINLFYHPSNN